MQFGTISVSDGISMGHELCTFVGPPRDHRGPVEAVMQAERLDGMVTFAGCDKSLWHAHGRRAIDVAVCLSTPVRSCLVALATSG